MEKVLWTILALLWLGMISAAAFANEAGGSGARESTRDPMPVIQADGNAAASPFKVSQQTPMLSVTSAFLPAAPISNVSLAARRLPMIEAGQHGGAELAGAFAVCVAAIWSARRRRII